MENVIDSVYNEQLHNALDEALQTLPEINRQAVQLRHYDQKNYTEIADMLNLSGHDKARRLESQALHILRRGKACTILKNFDYYGRGLRSTGLMAFKYNLESSVEAAVMRKIELEEEYKSLFENQNIN